VTPRKRALRVEEVRDETEVAPRPALEVPRQCESETTHAAGGLGLLRIRSTLLKKTKGEREAVSFSLERPISAFSQISDW
jgi:hypothetical protein